MALLVNDRSLERRIIARRRERGIDRFDEVWDGVYVMSPLANNEHQRVAGNLFGVFWTILGFPGLAAVHPGANVSDRVKHWKKNYRVPDVIVRLPDGKARDLGTHWLGGPDFVVEVVSKGDKTREKIDFYSKMEVRELLIVDRYPWSLELYRLVDGELTLVGKSMLADPQRFESVVVPFAFRLTTIDAVPRIEVQHLQTARLWLI